MTSHPPSPQGVLKYGHMGPIFWFICDEEVRHAKCDGFGETIGSNPIGFGNHFTPCYGNTKPTHLRKAAFTLSSIFYKMKSHAIKA